MMINQRFGMHCTVPYMDVKVVLRIACSNRKYVTLAIVYKVRCGERETNSKGNNYHIAIMSRIMKWLP
jgi:hypothetical protein